MKRGADSPRRPGTRQRGAALLLLLVVGSVAAASLLISAFSRSNVEQVRERRTIAALGRATDALVGFAATHGRLPRPAISAIDGRERAEPCSGEEDCSGFLPWVDLGVDGVSILSPRPISPGTRCVVMFEIPANGASTPVTLEAKSLHSALTGNGVFKVGMCFRDIDPDSARTLEAFIV